MLIDLELILLFLMMSNWITRKKTKAVNVGGVLVGGGNPIAVQSMTNTNTSDVLATVKQINDLQAAGADIVRVSVPGFEEAAAFKQIRKAVDIPLVADIHFDYKIALEVADTADCLRINPGNIGKENKVREVIQAAIHNNVPIRVGVNAGSLEKDLQKKYGEPNADSLVESALRHADILDRFNFDNYKMSLKASNIEMTVEAYRKISNLIDQPLHLGITEAGSYRAGTVKSSIGVGMLLTEGIGDTIRISLASDPVDEIKVGWDILKSLNIRSRGVKIIACPSCSRQNFNVIEVVNELEERFEDISEDIEVAIIGCYVNGPGESKAAEIGLTGASPRNLLYVDGSPDKKISSENLVEEIEEKVRERIAMRDSVEIIARS
jgi:(E)-4-hydroxy-3-methylbut-2-enyl-diphosphate synthase|tara:strand:+ start:497 stop:1633 length:1137 start_codon:yes stop_codon:yes gene_type:complete